MKRGARGLDVAGVLQDAFALVLRDREVLTGVAGLLLFVPQFAALLYWIDPPAFPGFTADERITQAYVAASQAWFAHNGLSLLLAALLGVIAQVAILLLYTDPRRLDVAGALLAVPGVFFPTLLASMVAAPLDITLRIVPVLILLGAYLQGRLLIALPVLLAEPPLSIAAAIRKSWTRTRGHGLMMAGLACIAGLGGPIAAAPFRLLALSFGGAPLANPVVAALLDGATALMVTTGAVFGLLIQIAAYRRLSTGT